MNKTKIIATIGPASKDKETLKQMFLNGMNVVRLNLSHSTHEFCKEIIANIRKINKELGVNIGIMMDLTGPDIRVGTFEDGEAKLNKGDKIKIYMEEIVGDNTKFSVSYHNLINDIKCYDYIKLDDGKIELKVLDKKDNYLLCEVKNSGMIKDHKSLNVPGIKFSRSFLSDKDKKDIEFANEMDIDFLSLSYVGKHEDVLEVKDIFKKLNNNHIQLIAKIENENALNDIDEIIRVSDGVMVARGDLGVEIPMERVPGIQKMLISKCHTVGKTSIVATEMLASMENVIRPTRAEVSDVANAVLDGTDAIMLSGETTVGKYPIETINMMSRIANVAEADINYLDLLDKTMRTEKQDITGSISYSVVECAGRLKCSAIIATTKTGYTARKISRFRPTCPIIALTPDEKVVRSLTLSFGVYGKLVKEMKNFDDIMKNAYDISKNDLGINSGEKIIITGGYPLELVKSTNFMKIDEL